MVLTDGHEQKVPAWPFAIAAFALGAFALLPYLILRTPNRRFTGPKSRLIQVVESRWIGGLLAVSATAILGYGLWAGDWPNLIDQWRSSRFIHVMGLDFVLLWLLVPTLLGDDMARRQLDSPGTFWLTALIPLVGPASYLMLRPPLSIELAGREQSSAASSSIQ
ncbi:DUF2834 domain-containing protein [filamentous cyanobacterium CCT1]|nr:DUF2834 domain-containing protein [filamentous cyanobacterium CCT1]